MEKLSAIAIKLDTYIKKEHPDIDNGKPSRGRDEGDPLGYAHYDCEWDTGDLFGEVKYVYNKTDESDNK
ncbi:hypothetical protein MN033_09835 [Bacillus nitratireducens]|uniref:hypothetical protein n=1 Tax=Bacillus nitratireducens TaxID=2026193 RepID=UPI001F5678A9|nr:hypothetical protein [Bacillus nitratireducens]UNP78435.1 hypothetical protein MN033_09835 [Bacillus nitratireducens]